MQGPDFRLDGKVALITGSGRGIGLWIARALAAQGAAVALQDIDQEVAAAEAQSLQGQGARAIALGGDVGDAAFPKLAVERTAAELGGLHILINNAAIQRSVSWLEISGDEIADTVRADMTAPILLAQEAVKIFLPQRWGRIINMGSIQQRGGNCGMMPYAMCKAALVNMTYALAREYAKHNITANLVAPGWFNTWRNREQFPDEKTLQEMGRHVPLGRIGGEGDTEGLIVLLCSEAGRYITGQSIGVDGGISARMP